MFKHVAWRAALGAAGALVVAAVVSACGGGDPVEKFVPTRLVAFGDETSVMEDDAGDRNGRKYSVNAATAASAPATTPVRDCAAFPIWIQTLASAYGLVVPQCNKTNVATAVTIQAQPNTKAAAVQTQIDAFLAAGNTFTSKTLVTVLAGQNDVFEQFDLVKAGTATEAQAIAAVEAAGTALAGQVNRIAELGGKVLISTIPDVGLTPLGRASTTDSALLTTLTSRFNSRLRINIINDGHRIGLLLLDEAVQSIAKGSAANSTDIACAVTAVLPDCSTLTLTTTTTTTMPTAPTATTVGVWLWSDNKHLGVYGHATLGGLAVARADGNPF